MTQEPPLSRRLFAKRAAIIAQSAARWASDALADDPGKPYDHHDALTFTFQIQYLLGLINRDGRENTPTRAVIALDYMTELRSVIGDETYPQSVRRAAALATDDLAKLRLRVTELEAALGSVLKEPPSLLYGAAPDPLEDMRTLAHAIEIPAYRWAPADVVEVLDRGADEIKRLRKIIEALKEAATDD